MDADYNIIGFPSVEEAEEVRRGFYDTLCSDGSVPSGKYKAKNFTAKGDGARVTIRRVQPDSSFSVRATDHLVRVVETALREITHRPEINTDPNLPYST